MKSIGRLLLRIFLYKIVLTPTVGNKIVLQMCSELMNFLPNQSEQAAVIPHSRSVHHKSYNPNTVLQLSWRPKKKSKTHFGSEHGFQK